MNELVAERDALADRVRELDRLIRNHAVAAAEFQVGDVVEACCKNEWASAIVRRVGPGWSGGPMWYRVSFKNNDGSWSRVERQVFGDVRAGVVS
jgi:hypothetical protein